MSTADVRPTVTPPAIADLPELIHFTEEWPDGTMLGVRVVGPQERPWRIERTEAPGTGPGQVDRGSEQIHLIVRLRPGRNPPALAAVPAQVDARVTRRLPFSGQVLVSFDPLRASAMVKVMRAIEASGLVRSVEPDLEDRIPDDPRFPDCWGLHNTGQAGDTPDADIDAPETWALATGSSEVVVAVIDTGIDFAHEDLAGNV